VAAGTRLIGIIGKKNCGKTTVVVQIAAALADRGLEVATIKHGTHPARADREGTDTWRHYHEGKATRVMIEGPGGRAYFERTDEERDPVSLARHFMAGVDIVIAEGFMRHAIPRIEVFRHAVHDRPHYAPDHPAAAQWIGMLSDEASLTVPFPTLLLTGVWLEPALELIDTHAIPI
jgi:molybdopterin-guanine dinucleotide biosynthesis protein MobB